MAKKGVKRKIFWILGFLIVSIAAGAGYGYAQFGKLNKVAIPQSNEELNISDDASKLDTEITNIALFGVDSRNYDEVGRSDSIMILSIDKKHGKIKISSIMRDTYVNVEGYGKTKITHAYAYGGPALAIKTLNSNFDLNIKDYATVNFEGLQSIIDSLGGVDINVKTSEIYQLNHTIDFLNNLNKSSINHISTGGLQHLNGGQAVAFATIRHTGNGDFERSDRQRVVITAMLEKVKSGGVSKYPALVSAVMPYVETSLNQFDIVKYGTSVFTANIGTIEQVRFPVDGYCEDKIIDGIWYLVADLKATTSQLHAFIYDDQQPTAK